MIIFVFQRCMLNEDSGVDYVKAYELGKTVMGLGGIGEVVSSASSDFKSNDLVTPNFQWPWQLYFIVKGSEIRKASMFYKFIEVSLKLLLNHI